MLKSILQNIALLAMIATISGGLITEIEGIVTSTPDANTGISVCNDLDTPSLEH